MMSMWISVKDKIPSNNEAVMVYSESCGDVELAIWNKFLQRFEYCDNEYFGIPVQDVSHWMPIPEPSVKK